MQYPADRTQVLSGANDQERWRMALRAPAAPLREYLRGYCLYEESRLLLSTRQHLPHRDVTLIVSLGGALDVRDPRGGRRRFDAGRGFVAGIHTAPAFTDSGPSQRGVEVALTPLGAHLLLGGIAMREVSNRVVALEDVLGRAPWELAGRLAEARGASEPFAVLDAFFAERILGAARRLPAALAHAWHRLERSHGAVRVGAVCSELGWSRRRLALAFRERIGLPPKAMARVLRFDRAMELLKASPAMRWSEIALECGYHDQAHLSREVRELSGSPPGELARRLLPETGGILG